ncbi:hypothetical protein [Brevibacillus brevis]|uniref:hypothetical protein n=1 Tax=Brevibacillus brevis TaxID=1393 RepID=UPI000D0F305D|nr:hypothetical protein [Brevibacillus brevis]PSJ67309.1 hypothetical protein C7J99_21250 [Brevibacillus brevis]RED21654.1 hypothetical protein DES34_11981 [Brevibacillus brevis]GEC91902.1 hypothetical protein BBR01nite_42330 [Brevibacillus brevis]VEF86674.1 Uncharacterised protein [Brevibacillus brevis]
MINQNRAKLLFFGFLLFTALMASVIILEKSAINQEYNSDVKSRIVLPEEATVHKDQHFLLSRASEFSTSEYTSSHSFELVSELEKEYSLSDDESFRYYINDDNSTIIKGKYVIDTTDKSNKVTFIALQGNNSALVRLENDVEWYSSLNITYPENSTIVLPVEIKWSPQGEEELTIFPLKHENPDFYNGANLGLLRYLVLKNDEEIPQSMVNSQMNINSTLLNKKEISYFPVPKWYDHTNNKIKLVLNEGRLLSNTQPSMLTLAPLPYSTMVDMIIIDESGKVILANSNIQLKEAQITNITLPDKTMHMLNQNKRRNFVILLNNRSREMLADMMAIKQSGKPYPTTFQLVIEYYKTL